MCLPNENITELLEFCYIYPFILIQESKYTERALIFPKKKNTKQNSTRSERNATAVLFLF